MCMHILVHIPAKTILLDEQDLYISLTHKMDISLAECKRNVCFLGCILDGMGLATKSVFNFLGKEL